MRYQEGEIYHVFNQGNNKQLIFFERENYLFFLRKMHKHIKPYAELLCYCLMPNHFHWLIQVKKSGVKFSKAINPNKVDCSNQQVLSQQIGVLLSGYTKAINKKYNRTGSLFRGRTKAKNGWIEDFITINSKHKNLLFRPDNDYAKQCFDYIHENPVKARLVTNCTDWEFSSAKDYAGQRKGTMCNQILTQKLIGVDKT